MKTLTLIITTAIALALQPATAWSCSLAPNSAYQIQLWPANNTELPANGRVFLIIYPGPSLPDVRVNNEIVAATWTAVPSVTEYTNEGAYFVRPDLMPPVGATLTISNGTTTYGTYRIGPPSNTVPPAPTVARVEVMGAGGGCCSTAYADITGGALGAPMFVVPTTAPVGEVPQQLLATGLGVVTLDNLEPGEKAGLAVVTLGADGRFSLPTPVPAFVVPEDIDGCASSNGSGMALVALVLLQVGMRRRRRRA